MKSPNFSFQFVSHRFVQRLPLSGGLDQALISFWNPLNLYFKLKGERAPMKAQQESTPFYHSQNHRMAWVGKELQDHLVPTSIHDEGTFSAKKAFRAEVRSSYWHGTVNSEAMSCKLNGRRLSSLRTNLWEPSGSWAWEQQSHWAVCVWVMGVILDIPHLHWPQYNLWRAWESHRQCHIC